MEISDAARIEYRTKNIIPNIGSKTELSKDHKVLNIEEDKTIIIRLYWVKTKAVVNTINVEPEMHKEFNFTLSIITNFKGSIFCVVKSINNVFSLQNNETEMNHVWKGGSPNLITIATKDISVGKDFITLIKITTDINACTEKYLTDPLQLSEEVSVTKIAKKVSSLASIAPHTMKKLEVLSPNLTTSRLIATDK